MMRLYRGEPEENQIGSNCGQYVLTHLKNSTRHEAGYLDIHTENTFNEFNQN